MGKIKLVLIITILVLLSEGYHIKKRIKINGP